MGDHNPFRPLDAHYWNNIIVYKIRICKYPLLESFSVGHTSSANHPANPNEWRKNYTNHAQPTNQFWICPKAVTFADSHKQKNKRDTDWALTRTETATTCPQNKKSRQPQNLQTTEITTQPGWWQPQRIALIDYWTTTREQKIGRIRGQSEDQQPV
jgi:hypothetical protein